MSQIHFIGGEKGGVGKSVVARALAQYFIDRHVNFAGIDADTSHNVLARYYAHHTQTIDLTQFSSTDQIMDRALGAERQVLVDLPAQSSRQLKQWMHAGGILSFAREMGVALKFWHVTDGGFDSVQQLHSLTQEFGDTIDYVVVKNEGRSGDFTQFEESEVRQSLEQLNASIITLPELHAATMYKIDSKGSSFWAAVHSNAAELSLSPMESQRTKMWLDKTYFGLQSALGF